jgi:Tfp pilus assembly protein PilF
VNNSNVLLGAYGKALPYFIHISNKYPNHALAHYVLANIYKQTGENELSQKQHDIYLNILNNNEEWQAYADKFCL